MCKEIMQQNGYFHFHKGHYLENNIIKSLGKVVNEDYSKIQCEDPDATDYLYYDAEIFLHGSCHLFALALHEEFGYDVFEIRDFDDRMNHVFCKSTYRGQDAYIDVRGITTDFRECMYEFKNSFYNQFFSGIYHIVERDIIKDKKLQEEGDKTGYSFAQAIIKKHHMFYDTSK